MEDPNIENVIAIITENRDLASGGVPIFYASSQAEKEKIALYLSRVTRGMVPRSGQWSIYHCQALGVVMHIIYTCYGGAHSSPMAAAIHLGRLPGDHLPSLEAIESLMYFDIVGSEDRGRVFPVGTDEFGNTVYILGRGSDERSFLQAVKSGYILAGGDPRQLLFVNTLRAVNWQMRIGGFLSRRLGLVSIGRPLVTRGARRAYRKLVQIVTATKASCQLPEVL